MQNARMQEKINELQQVVKMAEQMIKVYEKDIREANAKIIKLMADEKRGLR